jgi:hypothetical protein
MGHATIAVFMLVGASMCVLAVVWIQQRVIVSLERRVADLADVVLGLPDSGVGSLPAPPSDQ